MKKSLFIIVTALLLVVNYSCNPEEENNLLPLCNITHPINNQDIPKGEEILISVDAYDSDGDILEVRFFINDIGVLSVDEFPYNYLLVTDTIEIGEVSIKAFAYDNSGDFSSSEISVNIKSEDLLPTANFAVDVASGTAPLEVSFIDMSSNNPTSWLWNFGDGLSSTEQNPTHVYTTDGEFAVSLTVNNELGFDTELKPNFVTVVSDIPVDNSCPGIPVVNDSLGNSYKTVLIGNQCWMKDNLKLSTETGSWAYDDNPLFIEDYGLLYNWQSAMNSCPDGWHLPSEEDWIELINYLGGVSVAGGKIKETGSLFWQSPNTGATNVSGFTAYAGGGRSSGAGIYGSIYQKGIYWTSTEVGADRAFFRILGHTSTYFSSSSTFKDTGYSVRCLKD